MVCLEIHIHTYSAKEGPRVLLDLSPNAELKRDSTVVTTSILSVLHIYMHISQALGLLLPSHNLFLPCPSQ